MQKIKDFFKQEDGQGMVEYGLIIALVAIALIATVKILTGGVDDVFDKAGTDLSTAANPT